MLQLRAQMLPELLGMLYVPALLFETLTGFSAADGAAGNSMVIMEVFCFWEQHLT